MWPDLLPLNLSSTLAVSNDPSIIIVICLWFYTWQSSTLDNLSGCKVLHWFTGCTLLDPWQGQGMETLCSESRKGDTKQCSPWSLEPLPRKTNPADLPSRGLNMLELSVSQLWWVGIEWLSLDTQIYPDIESTPRPELCLPELKASSKLSHNLLAIEKRPNFGDVMSYADFSSLQRLVRVTAYVLRVVNCFKAKGNSGSNLPTTLTLQEILPQRNFGSHIHKTSWSSRRILMPWDVNLPYSSMTRDCGGVVADYRMPTSREHPFTALVVCDAHQHVSHNEVKDRLLWKSDGGTGL